MANFKIHARVVEGQTVSGFVAEDNDKVTFYNDDASQPLLVVFPNGSPLCDNKVPQTSINVPAGLSKQFKVCKDTAGQSFKYDATITGAATEDPIVIIEKASLGEFDYMSSIIGLGTGLVLGYLGAKLLRPDRTRAQT